MPFEFRTPINYRDLNKNWKLRLDALTSYLQESAILHSEILGFNANYMIRNNCAWILNKISIKIFELPKLRDEIKIETWSREIHTVKAYRDFNVYLNEKLICQASSLWVFVDSRTKKLKRVPDEVRNMYGEEKISNGINPDELDLNPEELKNSNFTFTKENTIRYTDVDTNGHLNNTAFFTLIEDALLERFGDFKVESVEICFKSELTSEVKAVKIGLTCYDDGECKFIFFKGENIFSYGRLRICF